MEDSHATERPAPAPLRVAFFVTCLVDTFAPRVGVAAVRVLRHFGCRVHFPERQTCCGQPAYNNGFHAEAARQGRRLIDTLAAEKCDYVVTPSGSCAAMVRRHLPALLADDRRYADRARLLAARTYDLVTFLDDALGVDWAGIAADPTRPVTCHYSCHQRANQPPDQASRIVSRLGRIDYRPLEPLDQCCGFGGAFQSLFPGISAALAEEKAAAIARTGARIVVCNEVGCTWTMERAARRQGLDVRFAHLAELLAEALGLMDDWP